MLDCNEYLEFDDALVPTGKRLSVKNTPFDFTSAKEIGKDFDKVGSGYDNCYCLREHACDELVEFANLCDTASGRKMTVATTQPGAQLYSANWIDGTRGKNGYRYSNHGTHHHHLQYFFNACRFTRSISLHWRYIGRILPADGAERSLACGLNITLGAGNARNVRTP